MTRHLAVESGGMMNPRRILIQMCDMCGTVSAVSTSNGTGLWVCDPCEMNHLIPTGESHE